MRYNQPLAGIVTNANASLRWLAREAPDLAEARDAIHRIVRDWQSSERCDRTDASSNQKGADSQEPT